MQPQEKLKNLRAEANTLLAKMDREGLTPAEQARATAIHQEVKNITESQTAMSEVSKAINGLDGHRQMGTAGGFDDTSTGGARKTGNRWGINQKAAHFTNGIMGAFKAAAPMVGGPHAEKQLIPQGGVSAPFDGVIIEDPRQRFSLPAALEAEEVTGPAGSYLRQTLRDNQAETVPVGGMKPMSRYGLTPVEWKIATIAHVSEPIALQWLSDYEGLQQFLAQELAYGVDAVVSDFILKGGTTEDGSTVTGLMNTSGVLQTGYLESPLRTIRAAIGELEGIGVEPSQIVMAPSDWEAIETSIDGDGNFQLPGAPVDRVNQRLWGVPVITPPNMETGEAVVGDLSTVKLLHRSSHQLTWTDAAIEMHAEGGSESVIKDLFRTNNVLFRDEVRVGVQIGSLKTYRVASLTAAE